jgi:hypothetical protein
MPKFIVLASEVTFYEGIIEAESNHAIRRMDVEDMALYEKDGEAMKILEIRKESS